MPRSGFRFVVRPGQVWTVENTFRPEPMRARVLRVEGGMAHCVRLGADGRALGPLDLRVQTLSRGMRHATLVEEAPGFAPQVRPEPTPPKAPERERRASDTVRTYAPRGITKGNARKEEGVAMLESGKTAHEVAAHFGVTVHAVYRWKQDVRDARTDAARLRANRRTG